MKDLNLKSDTNTHHATPRMAKFLTLLLDALALVLGHYVALLLVPIIAGLITTFTGLDLQWDDAENPGKVYYATCGIVLLLFYNKEHYTSRIPWWSSIQFIVKVMGISFLVFGFVSLLLDLKYDGLLVLTNFVTATALLILIRYILIYIKNLIPGWRTPAVLVGDYTTVTDALYAFAADDSTGYDIQAILFSDVPAQSVVKENLPKKFRDIEIKGSTHKFETFMTLHRDKFHIISIENFRGEIRDAVAKTIYELDIVHALIPSFSRMSLYDTKPQYFFGHDVMLLKTKPDKYSLFGRMAKRGMDIMLSFAALLCFLPILIVLGIAIKLEGQSGSLFYGGYRIGRSGKKFKCWKLQTMEPNSDHLLEAYLDSDPKIRTYWEKYRKLDHDPRVTTRTAKFIRKASLDEVPQLWNVLVGDMSIVGPRPILEDEVEMYGEIISEYMKVRPGITGLWQVSGRNAVSFARRVYWDSWYIRNWTLWSDIVIIIKTIKVVLTRHGAS